MSSLNFLIIVHIIFQICSNKLNERKIKMQTTREIIETFIKIIEDEIKDSDLTIINNIKNTIKKADFRKKYYRLKIWNLLTEFGKNNPSYKDTIDSLLTDLAVKWENTMTKALNDGILIS